MRGANAELLAGLGGGGAAGTGPPARTVPGVTGPPVEPAADPAVVTAPAEPAGWERVHEGSVLSAVLVTQLSGDFTGPVLAQVAIPFYSADRQRILVPRGARLLGSAQAVQHQDQGRLAVGFHRLVWPDGRWLDLAFHGLSAVGESALADQVDRHYASTFAAAGAVGVLAGLTLQGLEPVRRRERRLPRRSRAGARPVGDADPRAVPQPPARGHHPRRPPAAGVGDRRLPRAAARAAPGKDVALMTKKGWRWLIAALVVAVVAGKGTARRAQACLFGSCDAIIIANQVTQIAHMVTQIGKLVDQLQSLDGVLAATSELVTSNDVGMGNIGRLREVTDAEWRIGRHGIGLSTSTSAGGVGAFSQRLPGLSDEAGWLQVLAAPETALLATRPATEVLAARPGAFGTWTVPAEAAAALAALEAMGSGARSYRRVWDELEAASPPALTEADLRAVAADPDAQARLIDAHRRARAVRAADLVHAHAEAEAASALALQVGEASAALADLRNDDLMRTQRVAQAQLAAAVTGAELALAEAQLAAYETARAARQRYEAERARREALARWQADAVTARAGQGAFLAVLAGAAGALADSHRFVPSPSNW